MILTEEEAKLKICPQPEMTNCVGSGCMAWRWKIRMEPMGDPYDVTKPPPLARAMPLTHGYCGLAGKPE